MGKLGIAVLSAAIVLFAADQIPNLTGTWKLNVSKSRWGKKPKPTGVELTIQHQEPKLRISGTVANAHEQSDTFHFDGTIGGPPEQGPDGTLTMKRIDPYTLESTWKSHDGRYTEIGRTTISKNGKELSRFVEVKRPEGEMHWTEVYDRE